MKKLIAALGLALSMGIKVAQAAVHVRGYVRHDGTYVQPHYRSNPDGNVYNNWSTYPNVNPYTGTMGTNHVEPMPVAAPSWNTGRAFANTESGYELTQLPQLPSYGSVPSLPTGCGDLLDH